MEMKIMPGIGCDTPSQESDKAMDRINKKKEK
jgi:hypothetical protein